MVIRVVIVVQAALVVLLASAAAKVAVSAAAYPYELTRREVEVLGLLAEGLTDAEIAGRLFLSPHTVHAHLHSIYGKLCVTGRVGAARFAIIHEL